MDLDPCGNPKDLKFFLDHLRDIVAHFEWEQFRKKPGGIVHTSPSSSLSTSIGQSASGRAMLPTNTKVGAEVYR